MIGHLCLIGNLTNLTFIEGAGGKTIQSVTSPNCPDTGGNHLNFASSTGAITCGTSGSGGTPAGSAGQWQYDNSGSFGALTGTSSIPTTGWTVITNADGHNATFNVFSSALISVSFYDNGQVIRGATRALPAGSTYTVAWTVDCKMDLPSVGPQACEQGLSDGTIYQNYEILALSSGPSQAAVQNWTNQTTAGTTPFGPTTNLISRHASMCVVEDGTHRTWYHFGSITTTTNGWVQDLQQNTGTTLTPTLIFVGGRSQVGVNTSFAEGDLTYLFTSTGTTCP